MPANRRQHATFRYYGPLNDFLPPQQRHRPVRHDFELPASVKDIFESMGVPHPEVDLVLANSIPVDFGRLVRDGDWISVFPEFTTLELGPVPRLRRPLQEHRFLLDAHLGRLATYLRVLGFDALYQTDSQDEELARCSHREERILLTRDCGLLKRSEVIYGYFVRATEAKQQAIEVLRRFDLSSMVSPFTRCLRCNALLNPVPKESVAGRLQPETRRHYDEFRLCPVCERVYWAGSHYRHMTELIQDIVAGSNLRQH